MICVDEDGDDDDVSSESLDCFYLSCLCTHVPLCLCQLSAAKRANWIVCLSVAAADTSPNGELPMARAHHTGLARMVYVQAACEWSLF